jgi:hypothetical protein
MVSMDFFSIYLFLICLLNIKDCFGMGPMWTDVQRGASPCYTGQFIGVRRGVSKRVEDGRRPPAL